MSLDKKSTFVLGALYGAATVISGVIATKVLNRVIDEKIDKKLGTNSYNHCTFNNGKTFNSSVPPFGADFATDDDDFFGSKAEEDFDRESKLDSEEDTDNDFDSFFESED